MGKSKKQVRQFSISINSVSYCIVIFGFVLVSSCGSIQPVTLNEIKNFHAESPLYNPKFKFDAVMFNNNHFGVTLRKMEIGIGTKESFLAKLQIEEKFKIPAGQELIIPLTLSPSLGEIGQLFKSGIDNMLSSHSENQLEVKGQIVIQKFIFRKKYNIRQAIQF